MPAQASDRPLHHGRRGFRNLDPDYAYSLVSRIAHVVGRPPARPRGRPLQMVANDGVALRGPLAAPMLTWIGHSTFLVQLDGVNLLTDPIWSERTSPVPFAGPRRLVRPGLRFEDLPPIHAVLISHDHYDHLDVATVTRLARAHRPTFFVPLGLRAWFESLGIRDVVELDWWQSATIGPLTMTAVPAQHSSGRSCCSKMRASDCGPRGSSPGPIGDCFSPATPATTGAWRTSAGAWGRSTWRPSRSAAMAISGITIPTI
jgi:N-acyl-phosphatidylethanolamine-hydrolysing phospholipase D